MPKALAKEYVDREDAIQASNLARRCVQCGFCTATCPTFQITGNELDGPRGRISLIKGVLEGESPTSITQKHLDRCLLCRNCETTCPSGVEYGNLFSIGKKLVDEKVKRKVYDQILRWVLKESLTSSFFAIAMRISKKLRRFFPEFIKRKIPKDFYTSRNKIGSFDKTQNFSKKVLFPRGCVQPSMLPNINASTIKLLNNCGYDCIVTSDKCCGAIKSHLDDQKGSIEQVKKNIDSWWPFIESNSISHIVMNASACSLEVKKYSGLFSEMSPYYKKAKKISSLSIDLCEILPKSISLLKRRILPKKREKLAFHPPCTLQHGHRINGVIEDIFAQLDYEIMTPEKDPHMCCGSAGTYSVLQPKFANLLKNKKLKELKKLKGEIIVSANIGCISHLQSGTNKPVMHWVEVLANALEDG